MTTLELKELKFLSTDSQRILSDKYNTLYILENDILYDAKFDKNQNLVKGVSHRMSKINLVIN